MKSLYITGLLLLSAGLLLAPAQAKAAESGLAYHKTELKKASFSYSNAEEAAKALRKGMVNRESVISVTLPASMMDAQEGARDLFGKAVAHTGIGNEGDYLKWHCASYSCTVTRSGDMVTYDFYITYLTDKVQEEAVTQAVEELKQKLLFEEDTDDYTRFLNLYDFVVRIAAYSTEEELINHTAYGAVIEKDAVCQGYATLLYRLLLDYGIDNRIIVSKEHAWNLVEMDGLYYECDATWDSQRTGIGQPYQYALKSNMQNIDSMHIWLAEEMDDAVYLLPRGTSDYVYHGSPGGDGITEEDYQKTDIRKAATVILTGDTYYAEWEAGKTHLRGSYKDLPFVTVLCPDIEADNLLSFFHPLVAGTDYKTSVEIEEGNRAVISIQGMGNYRGEIEISIPTAISSPSLSGKKTGMQAHLSWQAVGNADTYLVYRKIGKGKWEKIASTSSLSYTDTVKKKGVYRYKIKACYKNNKSVGSKVIKVKF